jgi:uridylate kinase
MRLGGSIIGSPSNPEIIRKYYEVIDALHRGGYRLGIVVGGGLLARKFIKLTKECGLGDREQDQIAISISKIYAQIFALKFQNVLSYEIPDSIAEAVELFEKKGLVVLAGLKPGMTTDTVAALLAAKIKADLIIKASDQEGVYTKDPAKHADAKKISKLSFKALEDILQIEKHQAGIHQILDPEATKLLKKYKIRTVVLNGKKPENVKEAILGKKIGTEIT